MRRSISVCTVIACSDRLQCTAYFWQCPCLQLGGMKLYPAACSFAQHSTKGSSAAISLVSWGTSTASLQLALMHQPLHPALPAMRCPELQDWQGPAFMLEQPMSAFEGAEPHAPRPAADPAAVSSVIQAWHPTGTHPGLSSMQFVHLDTLDACSVGSTHMLSGSVRAEVSCLGRVMCWKLLGCIICMTTISNPSPPLPATEISITCQAILQSF